MTREFEDGRDDGRALRVALVLGALALALRIPGIASGLWLDEIGTLLGFVRLPFSEIVSDYTSPNNHVLYSVLGHLSITVFGESAWALRLPSLLFGAGTIPVLYLLVRRWVSEPEAVGAALIVAVSYHHVYFSQNARAYTGLIFFTACAAYLLVRALETDLRRYWIGFSVVSALNAYLLLTGIFVCVSLVAGSALHAFRGRPADRTRTLGTLSVAALLAAVLTLVLYGPMLAQMYEFYTTVEADVGWLPSEGLLGVILGNALPTRNPLVLGVGLVAGVPVVAAGLVRVLRRAPLAAFAFLMPPLIELGIAVGLGAGSYPRRFILLLPFGAMVGVCGVRAVADFLLPKLGRVRFAGAAFGVGVAGGMIAVAAGLPRLYRLPMQDFEGALEYIEAERRPGEVVAAAWVAQPPAQYYDPTVLSARTVEDLGEILDRDAEVWLVATMLGDLSRREPELDALIRNRFTEEARFEGLVGDGTVVVFRSRPAGGG